MVASSDEEPLFEPEPMLEVLNRHRVAYIVVGGYAANLHGAQRPTNDLDVTPETSLANLSRLAEALRELGASIRVEGVRGGLPFSVDGPSLVGRLTLNLETDHGDLDLTFTPDGTEGYPDLVRSAQSRTLAGLRIEVASLDDIIRSKTTAGRIKDLEALGELHNLAATERQQPPGPPARGSGPTRHDRKDPPSAGGDFRHDPTR